MSIRIGGVPEHFNYPWHYALANGFFAKAGLDVEWIDVKGGSGAMTKMLESNELDYAVVLTEGIVKHIAAGGKSRIIQQYVKSPLIWGIHSSKSFYNSGKSLDQARFARSRVGSGSHIMAYVLAEQESWDATEGDFVTVGDIDGALEAFENDEADILLWEKFMTKPLVNAGLVKKKGDLISPWPCFVLVANENSLKRQAELTQISDIIIEACTVLMKKTSTTQDIAKFFNLNHENVCQWYATVEWQTSDWISKKMLENVIETLSRVGVIDSELTPSDYCYSKAKIY